MVVDSRRASDVPKWSFDAREMDRPALTLADLHAVLTHPTMLPLGTSASPLEKDFRYENGDLPKAIRVTTDRDFFEMHSDSVEFWTPGSPAFPDLAVYRG